MTKVHVLFDGIAFRDADGNMQEAFRGDHVDIPSGEIKRLEELGAVSSDDPGYLPGPLERSRSAPEQAPPAGVALPPGDKPLDEMGAPELREYAKGLGLDAKGSKADVLEAILAELATQGRQEHTQTEGGAA